MADQTLNFLRYATFVVPATWLTLILMLIIFIYQWRKNVNLDLVSVSYNKIVDKRQYYRIVTATYFHNGFLHIIFNSITCFFLSNLEEYYGTMKVLRSIYILVLCNE